MGADEGVLVDVMTAEGRFKIDPPHHLPLLSRHAMGRRLSRESGASVRTASEWP